MRDIVYDVVDTAIHVKYDDLPADTVEITKKFILDTLATAVAGSGASGCSEVVDYVKGCGGKGESTVWTYGGKVIADNAALANSMMTHALDFDDTHDKAGLHANVSILPAAIAMAERKRGVSGKDLITATALGVDLVCRLGLGTIGPHRWVLSSVNGYFGATIAAGKILGLDENKLLHAMGIVYSQCAGNAQCIIDGGLVKRMQPAFAAKAAVLSTILAEKGITGAKNVFEGNFGFFPLYYGGKYDRKRLVKRLGNTFEGENLSVKMYPCCRLTHAAIDAAIEIVRGETFRLDDIVEVIVHVNPDVYALVGKPFQIRESPQVDAQFSIPYTVAIAIIRGAVSIGDFFEEKIEKDTQVLELARKVKVVADQKSAHRSPVPCVMDVRTKNNKVYSTRVDVVSGSPEKPASMEDVVNKFKDCVAFSVKPMPEKNIQEIISKVKNLEAVSDIADVVNLLA